MEKINCIILDDDLSYLELISSYLAESTQLEVSGKFSEPNKAKQFLLQNPVPLIFIDMKMPEITGIDFLKALSYKPYAIILSSFPDFALEGYEVNALDYVLKPFDEERFFAAVNRAIERIESKMKAAVTDTLKNMIKVGDGFFFIHSKQQYIKLYYKDILYVEGLENFVKIIVRDKLEPVISPVSLKIIENALPAEVFLRTHKSYIINMNHVTAIEKDGLKLGEVPIPVGPSYKDTVMKNLFKGNVIKR